MLDDLVKSKHISFAQVVRDSWYTSGKTDGKN
jgi:hypothetical protein